MKSKEQVPLDQKDFVSHQVSLRLPRKVSLLFWNKGNAADAGTHARLVPFFDKVQGTKDLFRSLAFAGSLTSEKNNGPC